MNLWIPVKVDLFHILIFDCHIVTKTQLHVIARDRRDRNWKKGGGEGKEQKAAEIHKEKWGRAKSSNFYYMSTEYLVQVASFLLKDGEEGWAWECLWFLELRLTSTTNWLCVLWGSYQTEPFRALFPSSVKQSWCLPCTVILRTKRLDRQVDG